MNEFSNELLSIGVVLTFIGTMITIYYTRRNLKTTKYIDTITSERIKWLDIMRKEVAKISTNIHFTLKIYSDKIKNRESQIQNYENNIEAQVEAQMRYFDTPTSSALGQKKEIWSQSDFIWFLHLFKLRLNPTEDKRIIDILQKVARLDNEVSKSEIKLIKKFADNWNIDISDEDVEKWKAMEQTSLIDIRRSVEEYLNLTPQVKQASELQDIIMLTIKADKFVSSEEQMFFDEATGMINNYIKNEKVQMYEVMLVPQRKKKIKALNDIFPNVELVKRRGGNVHIQGRYYSKEFAEAICTKYIELGIFSIWDEVQPEQA